MRSMKALRLFGYLTLVGVLVTIVGCGSSESSSQSAQQAMERGNYDAAARAYDDAVAKAAKEGKPQAAQDELRRLAQEARQKAADKEKARQSQIREQVLALLRQAKQAADSRDWTTMTSAVRRAQSVVRGSNDAALVAQVQAFVDSQPMALVRVNQMYRKMMVNAGLSYSGSVFDDPDVEAIFGIAAIVRDVQLQNALDRAGDAELSRLGKKFANSYINYLNYKSAAEDLQKSDSGLLQALGVAAAIAAVKNAIEVVSTERIPFENRLFELLGRTRMPEITYRSPDAPAPAVPAATVASAPATTAAQRSSGTGTSASSPTVTGSVAPVAPPATTAATSGQEVLDGDDDQLRRTGN